MRKKKNSYFNEDELKNILNVYDGFNKVLHVPNQLFNDLIECNEFKVKISNVKNKVNGKVNKYEKKANANHLAFAFSFLYLISYMYRYTTYTYYAEKEECFIDDKTLYMICNISPTSRGKDGVSYITKRGGLLEKLGYIEKKSKFPIDYVYTDALGQTIVDFEFSKIDDVEFIFASEEYYKIFKHKIYYPKKAFHIDEISEKDNYYDGYFYHIENTTKIDINVFLFCMSRGELGTVGFYLYSFLKSKCDYYFATTKKRKYISKIEDLVEDTGIGKTKLAEMLKVLEEHNMIISSHNPFVLGLPQGKQVPANSYMVCDYNDFIKYGKQIVQTRKVMSFDKYDSQFGVYLNKYNDDEEGDEIGDITESLPF